MRRRLIAAFCPLLACAVFVLAAFVLAALVLGAAPAAAQFGPGGPPAVGVVTVRERPMVQSSEFVGRVQATDRVALVARVTAFIEQRLFKEGSEVAKGDLLYRLERPPFEADVAAKQAAVAQTQALLKNAQIQLNRAKSLIGSPAGLVSAVDTAQANEASIAAQLQANQAQLQASVISLGYTEIRAPVAGKIGRTSLAVGNVVTPGSGPLATIVSQDPMYVTFPISVRAALELRDRYADAGGFSAVQVKLRLADGKLYDQVGKLDYADPSVAEGTDTLTLRASIANPLLPGAKLDSPGNRPLLDGEFVTVLLEGVQPVTALAIPRAAVLSDQRGSYVYVVGADKKVEQRRVELGQSTPALAMVSSGLKAGEQVVADGIQRVRPGIVVNPAPIPGDAAAGEPDAAKATPPAATPPAARN
jgi:membrane fusion protein (multidrug efflux system)